MIRLKHYNKLSAIPNLLYYFLSVETFCPQIMQKLSQLFSMPDSNVPRKNTSVPPVNDRNYCGVEN